MIVPQCRILLALILRNIRTRFFGHGLGFIISMLWPLAHILLLLGINALLGRTSPYGDSPVLFFATGLAPFMTFGYISRWTMVSVIHNRPLLAFPVVSLTDLLLAGAILEVLSCWCMVLVLIVVLYACGVNVVPHDIVQAAYALGASMYLGFAFGIINSVVSTAYPAWFTGYSLLYIGLYLVSGVFYVPEALPAQLRYYLSFNPSLQLVEWMRSAYYDNYSSILDKPYCLAFCTVCLFLGLLCERMFRGQLLIAK